MLASIELIFLFSWDPICCTSTNIAINENACINDRLNQPNEKFEHEIAKDLVYRGLQCWHQYDADNKLSDLIWKMEICPFSSSEGSPRRLRGRCPINNAVPQIFVYN